MGFDNLVIDEIPIPIVYDKYLTDPTRAIDVFDFGVIELVANERYNFRILEWVRGDADALDDRVTVERTTGTDEQAKDIIYTVIVFFGNIGCTYYNNNGRYTMPHLEA